MVQISDQELPFRLLNCNELSLMLGFTQHHIWRLVKAGKLPSPIHVTDRSRRWLLSDIEKWMADRIEASGQNVSN